MSKFHRTYVELPDGRIAWTVYEEYKGSRNGFPVAGGSAKTRIGAWWQALKACR